jgi:hypothetical protein
VGGRVSLGRRIGSVPPGTHGKVLGYLRRDVDLLVVAFETEVVLQVRPEDVVRDPEPDAPAPADR